MINYLISLSNSLYIYDIRYAKNQKICVYLQNCLHNFIQYLFSNFIYEIKVWTILFNIIGFVRIINFFIYYLKKYFLYIFILI